MTILLAAALVALAGCSDESPDDASSTEVAKNAKTEIYANDRLYDADGGLVAPGTLLATLSSVPDLEPELRWPLEVGENLPSPTAEQCRDSEFVCSWSPPLVVECLEGAAVAGSEYFCDWVIRILLTDPAFGATDAERRQSLAAGGLTVVTTLDPTVQTAASEEVRRSVPVGDPSGAVQVMAVVEPGTGQVKALAQSTTYGLGEVVLTTIDGHHTQVLQDGATTLNLNLAQPYYDNLGFLPGLGFMPGSAFQVFTLLAWLEAGHSLSDVVDGSPQYFDYSQFTSCGSQLGGGSFRVGNFPSSGGTMTVAEATQNSVNVAFMGMATQLDLCTIVDRAADLGVVQADPVHLSGDKKGEPLRGEDGEYVPVPFDGGFPASVLGVDNTTPLAMAGAFAAFGSGGVYCDLIAITQVLDAEGNELPVPDAGCHQEIDPVVADRVSFALSNVWTGTMSAVGPPGFSAAGLTGASNGNEHTWFVGYDHRLAAAVLVTSSLNFTTANGKTIGGVQYETVFGSDIAGPTWVRFAQSVLGDTGAPSPDADQGPGSDGP